MNVSTSTVDAKLHDLLIHCFSSLLSLPLCGFASLSESKFYHTSYLYSFSNPPSLFYIAPSDKLFYT